MRTIIAVCVVGWISAGCGATSEHPLCDESDAQVDERLVGWWTPAKKDDEEPQQRVAVGRIAGTKSLEMVYTAINKAGQVRVQRIPFHTTKIGDKHYLNVPLGSLEEAGVKTKGHVFVRYQIDGEFFTLFMLENKAVASAIEAKQIAGTVEKSKGFEPDTIRLTATKEALRAWVAKAPDAIWKPGDKRLQRVPLKRED